MNKPGRNSLDHMVQNYRHITIPADLSGSVIQRQKKAAWTFLTVPQLALASTFAIIITILILADPSGQTDITPSAYPTLSQLTDTTNWIPPRGDIRIPSLSDMGKLPDLADTNGIDFNLPSLHKPGGAGPHQSYNIRYIQHT